jgi:hypothetical protein
VKVVRTVESGNAKVALTLETLNVEAHSKLQRDDVTSSKVKFVMDAAVNALIRILQETGSNVA